MSQKIPQPETKQCPASSPMARLCNRLTVTSFAVGFLSGFESAYLFDHATHNLHALKVAMGEVAGISLGSIGTELVAVRGKDLETHETTLMAGVSGYMLGFGTKCLLSSQAVKQGAGAIIAAMGAAALAATLFAPGKTTSTDRAGLRP